MYDGVCQGRRGVGVQSECTAAARGELGGPARGCGDLLGLSYLMRQDCIDEMLPHAENRDLQVRLQDGLGYAS